MHQGSSVLAPPSNNGPLRRNQACHQCRARKLKCDAGRPCSTCKRSHAKAIASLTSAGQAVLADPCCTYDYAPGEDPWTATLRSGLRLSPPRSRSKSGSASPGVSANDAQMTPGSMGTSTPLSSSAPQVGPLRTRHGTSSRKRSPPYAPSGKATILTPDSAHVGSPASPRASTSSGAHNGFSSPLPPLNDARGLPGIVEPSGLHGMPPYVSSHSFNNLHQDFEYEEMAEMLYNPMGPLIDPPTLFSPLPSYVNPLLSGASSGNGAPLYAYDSMGPASLETRLLDSTFSASPVMGGIPLQDTGDLDFSSFATDVLASHHREPTR